MKRIGLVVALGLFAFAIGVSGGPNKHLEKYYGTSWDSVYLSPVGQFIKLDAIHIASPGSNDTLYIALNNDTGATQRFKLQPGTVKYITKENIRYIKIKAGSDSVWACIDIY